MTETDLDAAALPEDPAEGHPVIHPDDDEGPVTMERGARIYAIDRLVGTLKHVVVDEAGGEVTALGVVVTGGKEEILVPPDLVLRGAGSALFLRVTAEEFAAGASRAPRYESRLYTAASLRALRDAARAPRPGDRRRVTGAERDAVTVGTGVRTPLVPAASATSIPVAPAAKGRGFGFGRRGDRRDRTGADR